MLAKGLDTYHISTIIFWLLYKPPALYFIHSFMLEVKKDDTSSESNDPATATAILYMEIVSNSSNC